MKTIKFNLLWPYLALLALIVWLITGGKAFAQITTYTYTGAPMAGTMSGGTGVANYVQIQGTIVLAAALNPNQANQSPTLVSYSFNNNAVLDSKQNPGTVSFTASTVNGVITAWNFNLFWQGGNSQVTMSLTNSGDSLNSQTYRASCAFSDPNLCSSWQVSNSTAGTLIDPPPDPLVTQVASLKTQLATYLSDAQWYLSDDLLAQRDKNLALALVAQCRANQGRC